jgi:hypothetical protein
MLDDRPVKRHGTADRVRTRNIRESTRAAIVLNAQEEEQFAKWNKMTADRRAAEKAQRKAKEKK